MLLVIAAFFLVGLVFICVFLGLFVGGCCENLYTLRRFQGLRTLENMP